MALSISGNLIIDEEFLNPGHAGVPGDVILLNFG
jgi:hypothetical protein